MPKSKIIEQDGKRYTFEPGKNGSLTAPDPNHNPNAPLVESRPHVAKTIGPGLLASLPKKMAKGGIAGDKDQEVNDFLTQEFKPLSTPSGFDVSSGDTTTKSALPAPAIEAEKKVDTEDLFTPPDLGKPDVPRGTEDTSTPERVVSSHPGHTPDTLNKYIQNQETQASKYGPEQEEAVMKNILAGQNSFGSKVARGGAAFSDALMQGVAEAGNPGNLANIENEEQKRAEMQANMVPTLQKMNAEQMAAKERLQGMTSASPLGHATAMAYQKVFKQLFPQMSDSELAALTKNPSIAARIFPEMGPVIDKQVQNELKKMQIEATSSNQKSERSQAALKELAALGHTGKLMHPDIYAKLEKEAGMGTDNIPSQEPVKSVPKIGETYKGHIFVGGNPADKNSWKKK